MASSTHHFFQNRKCMLLSLLTVAVCYYFFTVTNCKRHREWVSVISSIVSNGSCALNVFRYFDIGARGHLEVAIKKSKRVEFIHQSWKTSTLPQRFLQWSMSWHKCFPNARHILWTDEDNENFVAKHYPWLLKRYRQFPANIYRADVSRYLYMFHYGGIYTDLDNECLNPFEHLLLNTTMTFGKMNIGENKEGYIQNSFMYSEPRHPMWIELLMKIMNTQNKGRPDQLTGPEPLISVLDDYRARFPNSPDEIVFYPARYFNPFSWSTNTLSGCKKNSKMSDDDLKLCRSHFVKTSYVVQYHTHVWGL